MPLYTSQLFQTFTHVKYQKLQQKMYDSIAETLKKKKRKDMESTNEKNGKRSTGKGSSSSSSSSSGHDNEMSTALKRELDDAMVKMKRSFREDLDRSSRAVTSRTRSLFRSEGLVYNLEKLQEIAFTSNNGSGGGDDDGLPVMTLGMYECGNNDNTTQVDTRRKIIHLLHTTTTTPSTTTQYGNNEIVGVNDQNKIVDQKEKKDKVTKKSDVHYSGGDIVDDDEDDEDIIKMGVHIRSNSMELLHVVFLEEDALWQWKHYLTPFINKAGLEHVRVEDFSVDD
jgi:hypothetical protein